MKDLQFLFAERYSATSEIKNLKVTLNTSASSIQGTSNLSQRVIKILLTSRGSDKFNPTLGTSINEFIKATLTNDEAIINSVGSLIVSQTETQIKAIQEKYDNLSPIELLDRIEIIDILYNRDTQTWSLRLAIFTQDGTISVVEI